MTPSKRVFPALVAALLPVTVAATVIPVGACSLFLDRVDLDENAHDLDAALEESDRLVRVEVVATSPPARDFMRGGLVIGTHEWQLEDDPQPVTRIVDDGRDLERENQGCWWGHDIEPAGSSFVLGIDADSGQIRWTILGDHQEIVDRLGEPTPLPRDEVAVARLRDRLADSRPLAARLSHHVPLGLWSLVVAGLMVVLVVGIHRRKPLGAVGPVGPSSGHAATDP